MLTDHIKSSTLSTHLHPSSMSTNGLNQLVSGKSTNQTAMLHLRQVTHSMNGTELTVLLNMKNKLQTQWDGPMITNGRMLLLVPGSE